MVLAPEVFLGGPMGSVVIAGTSEMSGVGYTGGDDRQ